MVEPRGTALVRPVFLFAVAGLWLLARPAFSLQESGEREAAFQLSQPRAHFTRAPLLFPMP